MTQEFIRHCSAQELLYSLTPQSVDLLLFDPPYDSIIDERWDNQWTKGQYVEWFVDLMIDFVVPVMKPKGSIIFFGGVGYHGHHPFWDVVQALEKWDLCFRNTICWSKRRGYGKLYDYLYCREEIAWFSMSHERTSVTFNIPLLDVKRGYGGFNKKYPAKSEYKRVTNVWTDIPELMRPSRPTEKPLKLMERFVLTHSNVDDLIVDPFSGTGTTGEAALMHGRRFLGCDADDKVVPIANERCNRVVKT
jgi:site-specific DNA-methyltransferase (adenine-specific)